VISEIDTTSHALVKTQPVTGAFSNSIFSRAGNFFVLTRDESVIVMATL
jgi:hypothetical protein